VVNIRNSVFRKKDTGTPLYKGLKGFALSKVEGLVLKNRV